MLSPSFEYVLPAIRGIQAGREYYVSMCPLRFLSKLFPLDRQETPAETRSRRTLNRTRISQIGQYIVKNPNNYTFSAITASIDADTKFEAIGNEADSWKIGRLRVPMDAKVTINDGEHRRAALEWAVKENPELGYETIAIIFFLDIGLKRSQQIFSDLNRYAVRSDPCLNILYDHRDEKATVTRAVFKQIPEFRTLTETERSHLSPRSGKLFLLSNLYQATVALLGDRPDDPLEEQIELAVKYWTAVSEFIPDWQWVRQRKVSAAEMRRDYIHSQAIALMGLGALGAALLNAYPDNWREHLAGIRQIDWSRSNVDWEGRVIISDRISQAPASVMRMTAYLKKQLNLPLTAEEECLENQRSVGGRNE